VQHDETKTQQPVLLLLVSLVAVLMPLPRQYYIPEVPVSPVTEKNYNTM
jgi:hypothetical protein